MIVIAASLMGLIGLLFAVFLGAANKWFAVEVDEKLERIETTLPGVNCGGCGYPSCALYAEAITEKEEEIDLCVVGGDATTRAIAVALGIEVSGEQREQLVAVVFCQGDINASSFPGVYKGLEDCAAAIFSQDVSKRCKYGCVGMGSCVRSCLFDAIHMSEGGIPFVDAEKCTACGACVRACPRDLIELHPLDHAAFVYCKNRDPGAIARKICSKACIACEICVKAASKDGNEAAVQMDGNLAVVTREPYTAKPEYGVKCPTAAYSYRRNVVGAPAMKEPQYVAAGSSGPASGESGLPPHR